MASKDLTINAVFILLSLLIFFGLAKLLLLCAGLCFTVDQQTESAASWIFMAGGLLAALLVIYKNRSAR